MNEEQVTSGRRVNRHYSAEDRVRLIRKHATSGFTEDELASWFCQ